jgi:hypothetical protein
LRQKAGKQRNVWGSLDLNEHAHVELAEWGQHDTNNEEDYRHGISNEV